LPATILQFRAPRSYTGQDVVEIHTVGSLPALRSLTDRLIALGARRALPGEFTARAYLNGRLDAHQVQGVLALIRAEDAASARQAARLARGGYRQTLREAVERLTDLIALIEAGIDFVEEEDIRFITPPEVRRAIDEIGERVRSLGTAARAELRAGRPHVALAGLANAGKSTLFNALLGRERAIVSPILGTTRDVLSVEIEADGVSFVLQDCAGLGRTPDELELAAHHAAERAADQADLVLWVHDATQPWCPDEIMACERLAPNGRVLVVSKVDLGTSGGEPPRRFAQTVFVSALRREGLERLRAGIAGALGESRGAAAPVWAGEELEAAEAALKRACEAVDEASDDLRHPEIIALELRTAAERLGAAGEGGLAEEVLGRIFGRFCVGK